MAALLHPAEARPGHEEVTQAQGQYVQVKVISKSSTQGRSKLLDQRSRLLDPRSMLLDLRSILLDPRSRLLAYSRIYTIFKLSSCIIYEKFSNWLPFLKLTKIDLAFLKQKVFQI